MAITVNATNYNGSLNDFLYEVIGLGNDVLEKGGAHLIAGVNYKEQLDYLETDDDPFEDYTDNDPGFAGTTTKYKRELVPEKMTLSGKITPSAWLPVWEKYRAQGTLTELRENPAFMMEVVNLIKNAANRQLAKLFWQGDKGAGAASPLRFFDGVIKKLTADSDTNVIFVTPAGAITQANVVDILQAVYSAMPDKYIDDPDWKILMNSGDFKLLQFYNNNVKETSVGVLDEVVRRLFLEKRIIHFTSLPASNVIGAKVSNAEDSNLVLGMYFDVDSEFGSMRVDYVTNFSKVVGYRVDLMADCNYRYGGDIVFYKPV
jgi:hypothetical protein